MYQENEDNNKTALFESIDEGKLDLAILLIERDYEGKDVNELSTGKGESPLYTASRNGHLDIVRLLIENKADVNQAYVMLRCFHECELCQ